MPTSSLQLDRTLLRLQALGEETRFAIVCELAGGERCVCELQADLASAQSRLSFHLRKLKEAGLIADRRDGRWVYYRLVPDALEELQLALGSLEPREPDELHQNDRGGGQLCRAFGCAAASGHDRLNRGAATADHFATLLLRAGSAARGL